MHFHLRVGSIAGIHQVIIGDLVLCKEACTEKVIEAINTECENDSTIEVDDSAHLDEISGAAIPEEIVSPVKVKKEKSFTVYVTNKFSGNISIFLLS